MRGKQPCIHSVKAASLILGDKWTPELLRFLANEPTLGFCRLQELSGGINPRTLSHRLDMLEEQGIIEKELTNTSRCRYRLSSKGEDLIPILHSMQTWSSKYPK